ncbi:hypothetical protein B0H21DRAFT_766453 [Amylocystis lapponica]|nr:hypothetical protein B0H21DRAFT_766453 [Amylocystis lapponica]
MPESTGRLPTALFPFSNEGDASYQLKRAREYQKETFELLSSHVHTMPEELHTTLHLEYDELLRKGNELAVAKNPASSRCRQYKQLARDLKSKTVRSWEVTASDKLWSMKDHNAHAEEKPKHTLRNAVSWSAFGLKDIFVNTTSNGPPNESDNEAAHQASISTATQHVHGTTHSFSLSRSDGSSSDGATRTEDHRASYASRSDTIVRPDLLDFQSHIAR